nr:hypothetical protein [uncultured Duncaniella sp.]
MLYLDSLTSVAGSHLVTGVTENEEGDQDESREKHGHYRKALFVGHIVADLFQPLSDFTFWAVPHLII